ncbi:unnamed protein product [Rhizoctonia solani]|uniref:Uncharacterized protein n=1 Tax=Rhizoctonia solani TaxID=456999 RepID=A0A8H3BS90_9AGAM|nr:unnamed protein product [Rhizoctonia solani]
MRLIFIGSRTLGCVLLSLLPLTAALDVLLPNHAKAELAIVPSNFTIMTPRDSKSLLDRQPFDFGSPYSNGFSGSGRFAKRQGCSAGFGVCPNDPITCCRMGGDCCGDGFCCKPGSFCYAGGCCPIEKTGCDNRGCCNPGAECCIGGTCCASGSYCVILDGKLGCCPNGQICLSEAQCTHMGYSLCANENFCCPAGNICYRNNVTNEPMCRDPNAQTTTLVGSTPRVTRASETGKAPPPQPQSTTNAGAIASGTIAGVVTLAAIIIFTVIWRRRKQGRDNSAGNTTGGLGAGTSKDHAYSSGAVPPTPSTADPFLTPMNQNPNPGVSYFAGAPPSVTSSVPQYSGLPEPQHSGEVTPSIRASAAHVTPHDAHHPHSISMSVTPMGEVSDSKTQSHLASTPPSVQNAVHGDSGDQVHTSRGLSNNETANIDSSHLNSSSPSNAHISAPPAQAPST